METASNTPKLLDEGEVASILGVTRRTLQGWRYKGRGPTFIRMSGRCVRYKRQDVLEFIEEHTKTTDEI